MNFQEVGREIPNLYLSRGLPESFRSLLASPLQGGNERVRRPPASTVNKIIWSRYVTLDSLISLPVLAGGRLRH